MLFLRTFFEFSYRRYFCSSRTAVAAVAVLLLLSAAADMIFSSILFEPIVFLIVFEHMAQRRQAIFIKPADGSVPSHSKAKPIQISLGNALLTIFLSMMLLPVCEPYVATTAKNLKRKVSEVMRTQCKYVIHMFLFFSEQKVDFFFFSFSLPGQWVSFLQFDYVFLGLCVPFLSLSFGIFVPSLACVIFHSLHFAHVSFITGQTKFESLIMRLHLFAVACYIFFASFLFLAYGRKPTKW